MELRKLNHQILNTKLRTIIKNYNEYPRIDFFYSNCPQSLYIFNQLFYKYYFIVFYYTGSPRFTIAIHSLKPYRIFLHVLDRDAFQHIAKVTLSGSDTYIKTYLSVKVNKLNKKK